MFKLWHKIKSLFVGPWRPLAGSRSITGSYDAFGGLPEPSYQDLLQAYNDTVFACISVITNRIQDVNFGLYFENVPGMQTPELLRRSLKRIGKHEQRRLKSFHPRRKGMGLEEVVDHELLHLLYNPNPFMTYCELIEATFVYMETTGNAYWLRKPDGLYILPTQLVSPIRSQDNNFIVGYEFGYMPNVATYDRKDIIHFKAFNPLDPYGEGSSPLRAAWQRVQLQHKELSFLETTLGNNARPDIALSPTGDTMITPQEAERLAKLYTQRFRGAGSGGVLVMQDPMQVTPLTFPPKDLAGLAIAENVKAAVCNAFGVPVDIFQPGQANRSAAEAAEYILSKYAIKPRITKFLEKLNAELCPLYDARLFLAADEIIPDDKAFQLQKETAYLAAGVMLRDEVRIKEGLPSQDWAKEPLMPPGALPANDPFGFGPMPSVDEAATPEVQPEALPVETPEEAAATGEIAAQALNGAQIASLLQITTNLAQGLLTPEAARAIIEASFPLLSAELVDRIISSIEPISPEQIAQMGGKAVEDEVETKAFQPDPRPLQKAILEFFNKQKLSILQSLKGFDLEQVTAKSVLSQEDYGLEACQWKALPSESLFDMSDWTNQMQEALAPIVQMYADASAQRTITRLRLGKDFFKVIHPLIKEAVEKATLQFCEDTNNTTSLALSDALAKLREEITAGQITGDSRNEMMRRVQSVFNVADNERAFKIAVTESSRAVNQSQVLTSKESGVVKAKQWLLSDDACPLCLPLSGKTVGLDEPFVVDGSGPYGEIQFPPRHPACRCTLIDVLED